MKTSKSFFFYIILFAFCFHKQSYSQDKEILLVNGNHPLTQLMVGKPTVLLDWMLDLKLSSEQELKIKDIVVNAWKTNNKAAIKSTTDIIAVYEQIFKLSEAERNKVKEKIKPLILEDLYKEPKDELSKLISDIYKSSNFIASKGTVTDSSKIFNLQKNNKRVGEDGFTGIY